MRSWPGNFWSFIDRWLHPEHQLKHDNDTYIMGEASYMQDRVREQEQRLERLKTELAVIRREVESIPDQKEGEQIRPNGFH